VVSSLLTVPHPNILSDLRASHMEPMIPDDNVEILAQEMVKHFPADAALRASMHSDALSALGYLERSKKWLLVTNEIKKVQDAQS
jgi:hypothetical protein